MVGQKNQIRSGEGKSITNPILAKRRLKNSSKSTLNIYIDLELRLRFRKSGILGF